MTKGNGNGDASKLAKTQGNGNASSSAGLVKKTEIGVNVRGRQWAVYLRATGLYGGTAVVFGGLGLIFTWGSPLTNAGHFVLAFILTFVCGGCVQGVSSAGRIKDALKEKEHYRKEVRRMARARNRLENRVLDHRMSSQSQTPSTSSTKAPK